MCIDQILRIVNLILIVIVPFGAVWFARYMQTQYNIHRDKLEVFKVIMSNKDNSLAQNNIALALSINAIPAIYPRNQKVLKKQRELIQIWKEKKTQEHLRETVFVALLRLMVDDLGYKKHLSDEDLFLCIHASDLDYLNKNI